MLFIHSLICSYMLLSLELVNLQVRPDELRKPLQKGEHKNNPRDTQNQRENILFTHLLLTLHHILVIVAFQQSSCSCVLCFRILQPSQGQNAPVSGQQLLRHGSVLHLLLPLIMQSPIPAISIFFYAVVDGI